MAETLFQNIIEFIPRVRGAGFEQLNRGISRSYKGLFSLKNMFTAFFGYDLYSSIRNAIPAMVDTSRQLGAIHARLFAATGSAKGANEEFSWLLDTTKKLGIELMTTSDQYSMFAASAKQTFNMSQIREIFGGMMKLQRVLHIPADRMQRVLWGLTRMSSEATIKMRDFYALQQLPGSLPIAMKAAGFKNDEKGVEKFYEAVRKRQVYSAQFIPKFVEMLNKQYVTAGKLQEAMNQVDAQIQLLQRHAQGFQVALAKAGFNKDLISTLKILNNGLNFLEMHAHGIYKGLKILVGLFITGIGINSVIGVVRLVNEVRNLNAAILTFQALSSSMGILAGGQGLAGIGAGITGGFASGGMLGGLIAFITNPWVWVPLAIAAIGVVLGFAIKKFFPNVWNTIQVYWEVFRYNFIQLLNDINNHPAVIALKKWFGTGKKGFAKDIQTKQASWSQRYPNHTSVSNVGGLMDAIASRFNWLNFGKTGYNLGSRLGNKAVQSFSKFAFEQKYRIDVHVDGVDDKKSIMDSVKSAFGEFAEHQKRNNIMNIANSKLKNRNPFNLPILSSIL